jgi:diphthine synthase
MIHKQILSFLLFVMVLYIIGLGLGDEKDITVKGLECLKNCDQLYLEYYTSILCSDKSNLESFYGKSITLADREMVESEPAMDAILSAAKDKNIGFLVVGDPLCATTHTDLILRAIDRKIEFKVVHNASVISAAASCGLQQYQMGYTVSIPWFEGDWKPDSFYDRIKYNKAGGMHTLCLLDIKVKEPDYELLSKGKGVKYLPPRFMTVNIAIDQLLEIESIRKENVLAKDSLAVGMARLGQESQKIIYGTLEELKNQDFGLPLHSLALIGELHPLEKQFLNVFKI